MISLFLVTFATALLPRVMAQGAVWTQCGGVNWAGPTTCVSGTTCTFLNDFYSQCIPSAAAPTTTAPAAPLPTGVTFWFPFGDSYTTTCKSHTLVSSRPTNTHLPAAFDTKGTLPAVGNPLGNPPFPGFTGGGGENYVGFDTVTFNKTTMLTYNYAYGGATIDAALVTPYMPTVLSLIDQVTLFLNGVAKKPATAPWTSANSLFSVWIGERFNIILSGALIASHVGINDIGNSYWQSGDRSAFSDVLLNAYFAQVQKLVRYSLLNTQQSYSSIAIRALISPTRDYTAGARNFLFVNVPPIDRSPLMATQTADARALEKSVLAVFNTKLAAKVNAFKTANSGVKTWLWDSSAALTTYLNAPTQFGFSDATTFGQPKSFWGNDYHPGPAAHKLFAQNIATLLAGSTWF
ncbi:hypothetical protein C8J57DRAFT_1537063 [Mycena rebaudengoi]|nr:hypothetical protein C8J57DRAFT_1537063 [Mycena rebaudengoi]